MAATPDGSDREFAMAVLQLLWPGSEVRPTQRARSPVPGRRGFVLLPGTSRVRVITPAAPRRVSASGLARNSAPVSRRQELTRAAGRWGLMAGLGRWSPDRVDLGPAAPGQTSVEDLLAEILGEPVGISIHIGTARANRKPVLRVVDSRGRRTLAFAKVGVTDLTRSLVAREAEALRRLGTVTWRTFRPPGILALEQLGSANVLVMSALPSRGSRGMADPHDRRALIEELAGAFGVREDPVSGGRMLATLRDQLSQAQGDSLANELHGLLDRFETRHSSATLRLGAWHGDFTPWNMVTSRGTTWLWDWERFAEDSPVGLDEYHYNVSLATHASGFATGSVLAGLRSAEPPGADPGAARVLPAAYLATIATRYVAARLREGGHAVDHEATTAVRALRLVLDGAT